MATPRKPAGLLLVLCLVLCAAAGHARSLWSPIGGSGGGRCEELYVAEEGETLQTISVKCDADFILDDNPHIQDTDDVGPGTVLFIRPSI
ncbi:unnamed protein product [Spirodela intermedia]|uniref:Uncharacterized protein n=1 Tax=Spirodela intermedia TaxID=51605 RepID=A0A7I8L5M6_SPIIN|nr:unnamed protein product [Spirodela intermedia]